MGVEDETDTERPLSVTLFDRLDARLLCGKENCPGGSALGLLDEEEKENCSSSSSGKSRRVDVKDGHWSTS